MLRVLPLLVLAGLLLCAAGIGAGKHAYDFSITDGAARVLGTGTIFIPFKLGSDGEGTGSWQFTPTTRSSNNKYSLKAKARLGAGKGELKAACTNSWFTLDFNPRWNDNNVTVSWAMTEGEGGTMHYCDFAGGHACASFRIARQKAQ